MTYCEVDEGSECEYEECDCSEGCDMLICVNCGHEEF